MTRRPPPRPSPGARRPERATAAPPGTLWIYGRHAVTAALANPARRCRRFVALSETAAEANTLIAGAQAIVDGAPDILDRHAMDQLLPDSAVHQGLAIAAEPLPTPDLDDLLGELAQGEAPHIVVVLDQVTDPHNVGAILRSAAAFAARAVLVPEHGAPPLTGTLAKAASGALEAVPLIRVTNLARALDHLKDLGFWSVGLAEDAKQGLAQLDLPDRIALVLGAEGSGLRRLTRDRCDYLAHLQTRGTLSSLNVSNAAAVALYELTRGAGQNDETGQNA